MILFKTAPKLNLFKSLTFSDLHFSMVDTGVLGGLGGVAFGSVAHFAMFENLVSPTTSIILRILMKHIVIKNSLGRFLFS